MTAEARARDAAAWRAGVLARTRRLRHMSARVERLSVLLESAEPAALQCVYAAWQRIEADAVAAGLPPIGFEPFNLSDLELAQGQAQRSTEKAPPTLDRTTANREYPTAPDAALKREQ